MRFVLALLALGACGGTARGLEAYRTDTQHTLESRNAQIQSCYDAALAKDAKAAGTVAVQFTVEKKTGQFTAAALDPKRTTASPLLGDCVLTAVKDLKLDPPDKNDGHATFVYEFKPAPAPAS